MPTKKASKSTPTKADTQREAILLSLESGSSRVAACEAASVGRSTFYEWLEKDEGFREAVEAVERALIETVESVALACALKAEDDPRYVRAMLAWLDNKAEWGRRDPLRFINLDDLSDEELAALAHGEPIETILARTRAGRPEAAGA